MQTSIAPQLKAEPAPVATGHLCGRFLRSSWLADLPMVDTFDTIS
jgi:hypothetical protein